VDKLLGDCDLSADPRDTIHALSKLPEFQGLSSSVRSHLKRAIQLQADFRAR
jgi:hypothetical protein